MYCLSTPSQCQSLSNSVVSEKPRKAASKYHTEGWQSRLRLTPVALQSITNDDNIQGYYDTPDTIVDYTVNPHVKTTSKLRVPRYRDQCSPDPLVTLSSRITFNSYLTIILNMIRLLYTSTSVFQGTLQCDGQTDGQTDRMTDRCMDRRAGRQTG